MYDKLQDFDNAEKMYLRIIDLEPGNMNNYYIIAEFYKRYAAEKKELKEKAEQMYLRRIETDPEKVQGYAYMANYYDKLPAAEFKDKFDQALDLPSEARAARARLRRGLLHDRRQPVQQGLPAPELPVRRPRSGSPPRPRPSRTCSRPSRSTPTSRTPTPT